MEDLPNADSNDGHHSQCAYGSDESQNLRASFSLQTGMAKSLWKEAEGQFSGKMPAMTL